MSLAGLAAIAAADLQTIVNDQQTGGCVITLQAPEGRVAELRGMQRDIAHAVDPETGKTVSARTASVVVSFADLATVNMMPRGESDTTKKPWVVKFSESVGCVEHTFKVSETLPDRTLGCVVLLLEFYKLQP